MKGKEDNTSRKGTDGMATQPENLPPRPLSFGEGPKGRSGTQNVTFTIRNRGAVAPSGYST
ncbi:hypothetical protein GCM10027345_13880 [Hymenobacter daeguensis]